MGDALTLGAPNSQLSALQVGLQQHVLHAEPQVYLDATGGELLMTLTEAAQLRDLLSEVLGAANV